MFSFTSTNSFLVLPVLLFFVLKVRGFVHCLTTLTYSLPQTHHLDLFTAFDSHLLTPQACQGRPTLPWRRNVFRAEAVVFTVCGLCGSAQAWLAFTRSQEKLAHQGVALVAMVLRLWASTALLMLVAAWFGLGSERKQARCSSEVRQSRARKKGRRAGQARS
jgi:hypothetical protein